MSASDTTLTPEPPFLWPEPRVLAGLRSYASPVPFEDVVRRADAVLGIVTALSGAGIDHLAAWLANDARLQARLVLAVYPTCSTKQTDIERLRALGNRHRQRLHIRLQPYAQVTDRPTNVLCFVDKTSQTGEIVTGASENFGFDARPAGKINFVFRADPGVLDSFQRSFTWLWAQARDLLADGLPAIPELVLPEGSEEAARRWETFCSACLSGIENDETPPETAQIDPETGAVSLVSRDNTAVIPPGEEVGLLQLDLLTDFLARLYAKGMVVTIDKLSRIPPLDAPLNPAWFGDVTEIHRGNVRRKVSMRVSIIDERTRKEIEKRRTALRVLLTKLSFGLADNVRWMPQSAQPLFETEIQRVNAEGQQLIADVLKGDVAAFIRGKQDALVADLTAMSQELGWHGDVPAGAIAKVMESLTARLTKAQAANFMPQLTYSPLQFGRTSNTWASPWRQAYALLSDIAAFPRKARTDFFFFRGLKVPAADVIEAMNVADDALLRAQAALNTRERCQVELDLLTRIEKSPLDPKEKCAFLWRIIEGDDPAVIAAVLESQENDQH